MPPDRRQKQRGPALDAAVVLATALALASMSPVAPPRTPGPAKLPILTVAPGSGSETRIASSTGRFRIAWPLADRQVAGPDAGVRPILARRADAEIVP